MQSKAPFVALLAGGIGERLWPISMPDKPKQFIPLFPDGESLLQRAWRRASLLTVPERILVVGSESHGPLVRDQLPELAEESLLLEPDQRGTAASVLWAALSARKRDASAVLVVAPVDHQIASPAEWCASLGDAVDASLALNRLVLLASAGEPPNPRFGHVIAGRSLVDADSPRALFEIVKFVEKPSIDAIEALSRLGRLFVSLGTSVAPASLIVDECAKSAPGLSPMIDIAMRGLEPAAERTAIAAAFLTIPSASFDRAVLERSERLAVLPCDFARIDVGDYSGLAEIWERDADGNSALGRHAGVDSRNNLIFAPGYDVVTAGLEDFVVAVHDGALVICPRDRAQEVKEAVAVRRARAENNC